MNVNLIPFIILTIFHHKIICARVSSTYSGAHFLLSHTVVPCFARIPVTYVSFYSNSRNIWFTAPGSAFPFIAFMVCPTRKPIAFSLPFR